MGNMAGIKGNTNINLNSKLTVNGQTGTVQDLMQKRADTIKDILINKLGVDPKQLQTGLGNFNANTTTTTTTTANVCNESTTTNNNTQNDSNKNSNQNH